MTGCPSREQLWSLIAEPEGEGWGSEIGVHARACPDCRAWLGSFRENAGTEVDLGHGEAEAIAQTLRSLSGSSLTHPDTSLRVEWSGAGPAGPSAHDPSGAVDPRNQETWASTGLADLEDESDTVAQGDATVSLAYARAPDHAEEDVSTIPGPPPSSSSGHKDDETSPSGPWIPPSAETMDIGAGPALKRILGSPPAGTGPGPANYEILGVLGRGGMGVVYKAIDLRLNRPVALKMIRGDHAGGILLARFKIEAEAVASLRHLNILQIYEIGESDGSPFVALELLEGGSLIDRLRKTTVSPRQAAEWMVSMALAMDAAHRAGIIHRDLKCANILFTSDGVPKITDFGLAKRIEEDEGQTQTGQVLGTPSYMAPEQARGDTKSVGPPADIYALGTVLYEMLTGRPPFKGASAMDTVKQVIETDPVAPSRIQLKVPRDLETICLKCLQKEPRKRYATAQELADDLQRYLAGEPIRARRTPPIERAIKWARRRPTFATLLATGTLVAIALIAAGVWYSNHRRNLERIAARTEARLREETAADLLGAREALSRHDLEGARVTLTARQKVLRSEGHPGLTSLQEKTGQMLAEVERELEAEHARQAAQRVKDEALARYRLFLDRRKEALFRDTQFTDLMLPTGPAPRRQGAEEALDVFASRGPDHDWTVRDLAALSAEQRTEVAEGCYELLLILAGAVADEDPSRPDRALRILDSARRLRPTPTRGYHLRRASYLARQGDKDGEKRELAEAGRVRDETAFDHYLSGHEQYQRGRWADAIQDFEAALRIKPDHFWAQCLQAICYYQTKRFEGAKTGLTACLQADPDLAWLYYFRALASGQIAARYLGLVKSSPGLEAALRAGADFEFDEAEADFRETLARLGSKPDEQLHSIVLHNRGLVRFQRGRVDEAAADYRQAIELNKDLYLAYAELAHVAEKRGDLSGAIEQFTRAIAVNPKFAPLYRGRAAAHMGRGDPGPQDRAAALADLKMAIEHERPDDPVRALDHTKRGRLLYQEERLDDALEECRLALHIVPEHLEAHILEVQILLKMRRYSDVIRACDAAIALARGRRSPLLFELRGLARAAQDDYAAAIRDYTQAIEIRPADARLLARRGWAYLVLDSHRLALADFDVAIALDKADADAYNGRGTARVWLGDYRTAVADAREALRLDVNTSQVKYNAARIYAKAAQVAAADQGTDARTSRALSSRYQEIAVHLIGDALAREAPEKRESFWRDTIQKDPFLAGIRRRLKFEEPAATSKRPSS